MECLKQSITASKSAMGSVFVMTHSLFSDVIRIGYTSNDPVGFVKELSKKTPGNYKLVFAQQCKNPCAVKNQVCDYLLAKKYINEFYQVPPEVATRLLKREALRIPTIAA